MVIIRCFLGGWDTHNPPQNIKNTPHFLVHGEVSKHIKLLAAPEVHNFFKLSPRVKPLETRGEAASIIIKYLFQV